MKQNLMFLVTFLLISTAGYASADAVKLSGANKCHDNRSHSFNDMAGVQTFQSMEQCLQGENNKPNSLPEFYKTLDPALYQHSLQLQQQANNININNTLNDASKSAAEKNSAQEAFVNQTTETLKKQQEAAQEAASVVSFQGLNWNPAIATLFYSDKVIDDITIYRANETDATGKVFIGKEFDTQVALMIEVHYYWRTHTLTDAGVAQLWGHGPFVATSAGGSETASLGKVFGFGYMVGAKREGSHSMNVSIGVFTESDATMLRGDLVDGDITAAKDSTDLIRKKNAHGWMLMVSGTF